MTVRRWLYLGLSVLAVSWVPLQPIAAYSESSRYYTENNMVFYDPAGDNLCQGAASSASTAAVSADLPPTIPEPHRSLFIRAGTKFNVNPQYLAALFLSENANEWRPFNYKWAVSPARAAGPMQFVSDTWNGYKIDGNGDGVMDVNNIEDAIFAAANMLSKNGVSMQTPLGNTSQPLQPGTFLRAAAAYNAGGGKVQKWGDNAPLSALVEETRNYVSNVYALVSSGFTKGSPGMRDPAPAGSNVPPGQTAVLGSLTFGCTTGGGIGSAAGLTFPLKTTKKIIQQGVVGAGGSVSRWCFAQNTNCHHDYNAADLMAPTGTVAVAAKEGTVQSAKDSGITPSAVGSTVAIKGSDNNLYYYAHMGAGMLTVKAGQQVAAGQEIGAVGTAQDAQNTVPHVHFDVLPPQFTYRVSCIDAGCKQYPFIDIQSALVAAYNNLP